jgi:predicted nucleic acid-binding protein
VKRVVVADASPILYLHLIGEIELLPALFAEIHLPVTVYNELCHTRAPEAVREWALAHPNWLTIASPPGLPGLLDSETASLDDGERAAIALAELIGADLVLMDERKGVRISMQKGFEVTGTLGILDLAARRGLIDLEESFDRLRATNFRYRPQMLEDLLARYRAGG